MIPLDACYQVATWCEACESSCSVPTGVSPVQHSLSLPSHKSEKRMRIP